MTEDEENLGHYKFGTIAKIEPKDQVIYFVVIDRLNKQGGVSSGLEDVRQSLKTLWQHLGEGSKRGNLVIPIIATRFSGIPVSRETMIIEIINSFIDATYSEKHFCEKLTIIISPDDYKEQDIDLQELGNYLHVQATQIKWETPKPQKPVGESIRNP